jgi:hypothetical protein
MFIRDPNSDPQILQLTIFSRVIEERESNERPANFESQKPENNEIPSVFQDFTINEIVIKQEAISDPLS